MGTAGRRWVGWREVSTQLHLTSSHPFDPFSLPSWLLFLLSVTTPLPPFSPLSCYLIFFLCFYLHVLRLIVYGLAVSVFLSNPLSPPPVLSYRSPPLCAVSSFLFAAASPASSAQDIERPPAGRRGSGAVPPVVPSRSSGLRRTVTRTQTQAGTDSRESGTHRSPVTSHIDIERVGGAAGRPPARPATGLADRPINCPSATV